MSKRCLSNRAEWKLSHKALWPESKKTVIARVKRLAGEERVQSKDRSSLPPPPSDISYRMEALTKPKSELPEATRLTWKVLPVGWWRNPSQGARSAGDSAGLGGQQTERLIYIDSLKPIRWYSGEDLLDSRRYYVALFRGMVAAESADYGNALFILESDQDWKQRLSLTKSDLLRIHSTEVTRIVHTGDWRSRLKSAVKRGEKRRERSKPVQLP